jgi:hypothetical protein
MKIDPEITPPLEKIQKVIRSSERTARDLAKAQRDADQLQQTIDGIGEPKYTDDAKIALLDATCRKLDLCRKAIAKMEERLDEDAEERIALVTQGGYLAQRVLTPILDRRRETIAAIVRPFCQSDYESVCIAQQTSSYAAAFGAIAGFSDRASQARYQTPQRILELLVLVATVLKEALKGDGGDLMQFLVESPTAPAASAETATPSASVDEKAGAQ